MDDFKFQEAGIMADTTQDEARPSRAYTQEDKDQAVADYRAAAQTLRDRTARLRALRLAKEADEMKRARRKTPSRKAQQVR